MFPFAAAILLVEIRKYFVTIFGSADGFLIFDPLLAKKINMPVTSLNSFMNCVLDEGAC